MPWEAILIVFGGLFIFGAGVKLTRWARREYAIRQIPADEHLRIARGIDIRVLLNGAPPFAGMHPTKLNRTRGDLVLTADQFLLCSGKGILAKLQTNRGRKFTSVRCTGPARLVIEGDVPKASGSLGLYRFELVLPEAQQWADALAPWTRGGDTFGSVPRAAAATAPQDP